MSKLSRAIKFVIAIWLIAFGLATPQALQFGVVESPTTRLCTVSCWAGARRGGAKWITVTWLPVVVNLTTTELNTDVARGS